MVASEKVDLEMRRISGKLNEHFAFLNANGAMIAYIVYTLGLYVSDFAWKITSTLDFCSFCGFELPKKLFEFNRLIVIR